MASRRTIVILSSGSEDDDIEVVAAVQHRRRPRTPPPRPMLDESIIFIDSGGKATGPHRKRSLSQEIPPQEHSLQDAVMFQEADQYGFTDEIISPLEMEQRKAIFKQLAEIYGDEDMGFGFKGKIVKVGGEDVPRSFTVTVIPQANQSTNGVPKKFFFMTVVNPENPEYGGAFKVFPPIRVKVEYLTNATREVKIMLTCSWLRKDHVKSLTSSMHDNLLRYHGDVIGCLDWLERNGIHSLSLLDGVGKIYYSSRNHQANYIVFHDPRAVLGLFLAHTKRVEEREKTALGTSRVFDCDICFEHKPSLAAHIFDECKHFFCRACVGQDWQIKIQDAQLGDLACPAKDCKSKGNLEMIRDLVDFNSFRRYCDLTTESLCDTMATIVRCPRKECNVPMELHPEAAKEVTCLHCRYQFCSACKGKQHPNEPCLSEDQKKQIREEWAAADNVEKEALKKRYGADNVKFALEDAESQTWISANSKPCPKCKAPIQKVDGCNKMVCSSKGCRTYFCWLCLAVLDQQHPYNHFNPGQSGCANQLHTGAIGGGPPNILAYRAAAVQGAPVRLQLAPVAVGAAPGALNIGMMIRPRAHPRRAAPPRARRAVRNNVAAAVPGLDADAHNRAREAMEAARAERDRQRLEREERARLRAGQRAHRGGARGQ